MSLVRDKDRDPVLSNVSVEFKQGQIIAIVGGQGAGKSLLMRLLSYLTFPDSGFVFVPSHLRSLYVPQMIMMPEIPIWDNLTLGNPEAHPDRVREVVKGLNMHETSAILERYLILKKAIEDEKGATSLHPEHYTALDSIQVDTHSLPHAEVAKMQLARALIMNPELLIMQGPLSHFPDKTGTEIWEALRQHRDNRGYKLPKEDLRYRRPRTLIFSPTSVDHLQEVDAIWEVDGKNGLIIHNVDREFELTETMIHKWRMGPTDPKRLSIRKSFSFERGQPARKNKMKL